MTQSNILEQAKQGNPEAIAVLLNRHLQPKGISVKTAQQDRCLQIMVEAAQVPNQQAVVTFIYQGITKLGTTSIERIKIYGRKAGDDFPAWNQEFELIARPEPQQSTEPVTNNNPGVFIGAKPQSRVNPQPKHNTNIFSQSVTAQTPAQKKLAKSKAYEYGSAGIVLGLIFALPSVWGAFQMLQISGGDSFFWGYVFGIGFVACIGYLSGVGQGMNLFDVVCPGCTHKFTLHAPTADCPSCRTSLYIDEEGDCQIRG